jgi:hypothetical protein
MSAIAGGTGTAAGAGATATEPGDTLAAFAVRAGPAEPIAMLRMSAVAALSRSHMGDLRRWMIRV